MFEIPDDEVEAEYVEAYEAQAEQPHVLTPNQQRPGVVNIGPTPQPYVSQPAPGGEVTVLGPEATESTLAVYEKRARAVSLFIKVPLLAFVAFNEETPGLIRLGAGLLAIYEATQLARGGAMEIEQTATEWMG